MRRRPSIHKQNTKGIREKKPLNETNATNELLNHSERWTAKIIFRTAANEQAKQLNEKKRNITGKCGANFQWDPLPSPKTFPFPFELFFRFVYARWAEWPVFLMYAHTTQTFTVLFRALRNSSFDFSFIRKLLALRRHTEKVNYLLHLGQRQCNNIITERFHSNLW